MRIFDSSYYVVVLTAMSDAPFRSPTQYLPRYNLEWTILPVPLHFTTTFLFPSRLTTTPLPPNDMGRTGAMRQFSYRTRLHVFISCTAQCNTSTIIIFLSGHPRAPFGPFMFRVWTFSTIVSYRKTYSQILRLCPKRKLKFFSRYTSILN